MPTKSVSISFDFQNTDIHYVNVFDFFISHTPPLVLFSPNQKNPRKIEVNFSDWAFPMSGVIYNWVLEEEIRNN